jgi:acyl dehydratase
MNPELSLQARLPPRRIEITTKSVIMGAVASRDWQPLHHDVVWARSQGNLPDIILNNYTQAGLISCYVTDWSGPAARIGRLRFSMRSPICPGDVLVISGVIQEIEQQAELIWVVIAVALAVSERVATTSTVRVALPVTEDAPSVWQCPATAWRP